MGDLKRINKVLVANRGEIAIRVFRACTELGIRTVAIYSKEDRSSLHRFKADEAYLIGEGKKPIDAYLDIEGIIQLARDKGIDAIHPGYGFLSENIDFAKRCEEEGIIFIGPKSKHLDMFGDKVKAREQAIKAGIPVIPGSGAVFSVDEVLAFGEEHGYPIIIKATLGGGGRGMRIVNSADEVPEAYDRAKSEAKAAFGDDEIYIEKLLTNPEHIEVQILGDNAGNIIHLYERDCSIQRRHQKLIEVAPSLSLSEEMRNEICNAAVDLMKNVDYVNAGTVEFLVSEGKFYFIEVNPRVQVEHTITEMITGIDIVHTQILVADGFELHDDVIQIPHQENIKVDGYAIQSRVTTEDPRNNFMPDTGKILAYRTGGGFGVRLDAGNGFPGAVITPHYDSLLVKVSTWGRTYEQAIQKMVRNLREFRIRGIKTNIPFLEKVMHHEKFITGKYDTTFVDTTTEIFEFAEAKDRGTKMLSFIGDITVNGVEGALKVEKPEFSKPIVPKVNRQQPFENGTKQILDEQGPEGLANWVKEQDKVLLTDTTFRDAHQSLLATRIRTKDLLEIAEPTAKIQPNLFSVEMWGGATFDVAYRFLKEDPWVRLEKLREKMPNVLFQMLLRASNAVGYKNYPDNLINAFVEKSAERGIDVFRIFDSLNWFEGMTLAIEAVRKSNKIAEAAMCYTGNMLDKGRSKYDLDYYVNLGKQLENAGAHILAIKDMAGLLKPEAAYQLISTLKEKVDLPIHLHTHDTSGNGIYMYARAIDAGVDIVDTANGPLAGMTSQPSGQTLFHALEGHDRQPEMDIERVEELSYYWEGIREYYSDFESGMKAPHTEIYNHEMPGGQYSNLQQQAKAVGLGERWNEVKKTFRLVNDMFGDIVKVTPSSKVVGDMALFMVQNNLTEQDVYEKGHQIDFPESVIEFASGYIGQPYLGFPEKLQKVILKDRKPITVRPGELLEPVDFDALREELEKKIGQPASDEDVIAYALYPKVFLDYKEFCEQYGDMSLLDTPTFFYGMKLGEEIDVEIEEGKTLIINLVSISEPKPDGTRVIYFELNGQTREIVIKDKNIRSSVAFRPKVEKGNEKHIGATMPGTVLSVNSNKGDEVKKGDHLLTTEAMKMETSIQAPFDGVIKDVYVKEGSVIEVDDILIEFE
ncbi:pyruvate carboxylase [Oceanobacillus luteolus]|uniref:Pyruvate carboxylase n=1 Tax=Oceanobacillus luteolus TaxID=1274358 RepID=A0ABW4HT56_9BACI|nr:pyruvate carboxylase [Oceanobacillus luteolus]MCM3741132.1 pyruvate carboxylase [Oceanobacillus luteolus]